MLATESSGLTKQVGSCNDWRTPNRTRNLDTQKELPVLGCAGGLKCRKEERVKIRSLFCRYTKCVCQYMCVPAVQQVIQVHPHCYRKIEAWNGTSWSLCRVNTPKGKTLIDQPPIFVQLILIKGCHSLLLFSWRCKGQLSTSKGFSSSRSTDPEPRSAWAPRAFPEGPFANTKARSSFGE